MSNDKSKTLMNAFVKQYPEFSVNNDKDAIEFADDGSNYRVYLPTGKIHSDGSMDLVVKLDHIIGGNPDDHAQITASFNADGTYKSSPTVTYKMSDGTQIPDWAFYTVDGVMSVGGIVVGTAAGIIADVLITSTITAMTAGTGVVVAPIVGTAAGVVVGVATDVALDAVAFAVTGAMDLFNYLSGKITEMSDDGGSIYFLEVVAHTMNRLSTAVLVANNDDFTPFIKFDHGNFLKAAGFSSWNDKGGAAVKYNDSSNGTNDSFRTWKQDVSINYLSTGMLVSCKIDGIRNNNTDDHIILAALYGASGALVSAQATIRMENEATLDSGSVMFRINEDNTFELIQVTSSGTVNLSASYSDIPDALYDILDNSLKAMSGYNSFPTERKKLARIAKINLNWMNAAIKIKKQ